MRFQKNIGFEFLDQLFYGIGRAARSAARQPHTGGNLQLANSYLKGCRLSQSDDSRLLLKVKLDSIRARTSVRWLQYWKKPPL